jgi:predicted heme/steroid binding protein/rhodanese-related sulfurtransferase
MRKFLYFLILGILACFLFKYDALAVESGIISVEDSTMPKASYVNVPTVRQWQKADQDFLFIDVRRPDEYAAGHLPDAINIPYNDLEDRIDEVPLDRPVVFYCTNSTWRAPYAANELADEGYNNTYILEGGASAWNAGGQVIYADDPNQKIVIVPKPKDLKAEFKHPPTQEYKTKIDLTLDQLKEFDGKNGRPAYVAVDGVIYDVTASRLWRGGEHDPSHGLAYAGQDLSVIIEQSPHGIKNLQHFPVVGRVLP